MSASRQLIGTLSAPAASASWNSTLAVDSPCRVAISTDGSGPGAAAGAVCGAGDAGWGAVVAGGPGRWVDWC